MNSAKEKIYTLYIPLQNVDSEHCAMIIDKKINTIEGIKEHRVELNNKRVKISAENVEALVPTVVKEIRELGYDVPTIKKIYPVLNLSCASCANSSQNILNNQPGVLSASVNYANTSANIEYIPGLISPEELKAAVQSAGYDLMITETEEAEDSLKEVQKEQYKTLRKRTIGAFIFSIPLIIIGMTPALMHLKYANYIMWALATPVVLIFGKQFFTGAYKQAKHRSANMDTLVAVSTGVAYIFSVFNTLFPSFWTNRGMQPHVYFEASAVVIAFILLGKILEEKAKNNTSSAIKKLMGLQPKTVTVIHEDGKEEEVPIKSVKLGMKLLVKPGEKIAVDGTVISGTSFIDESMISGEPIPVEKNIDDIVFAGTINQKGSFQFIAEKVGGETLLAQIIKTVQEAQGSKAPVQKLVDKVAGVFVPVVFIIAFLTLIIWTVLGGENSFIYGFQCFVTVLVIACPCALGLATPTAIMVGVGKGAENGILIKDAESLEMTRRVNTIVLDKTGTITEGKPQVNQINWFTDDIRKYIDVLYSIEKSSEHPLAESVSDYLKKEGSVFIDVLEVENIPGSGVQGVYARGKYYVGSMKLILGKGITIDESVKKIIEEKQSEVNTLVIFADETKVLAVISLSDKIKSTSKEAIKKLHELGIEISMLTGDNEQTAKSVAEHVGIRNFKAEVSPQGKIDFIKNLQNNGAENTVVAMIGDGINDSAALAQANVSIAMGKGSDIAMDVAKMTIISGDLLKIPQAVKLSGNTVRTIKQNLFWAFIYNIIGIPIAAGVLYSFNGFLLNPMLAGAAMALSSISVVSNSILLKYKNI